MTPWKLCIGIILYVFIGGLFAITAINAHYAQCNKTLSDSSIALFIFGWPAVVPIGLLIDVDLKSQQLITCKE